MSLMRALLSDVHSAVRSLRRRPAATLATIGVLSLGLAAGVAVYAYVGAFGQTPPGAARRGLVEIFSVTQTSPSSPLSYLDFEDYDQAATGSFEALAAVQSSYAASVRLETMTEVAFLEAVSGRYFDVFGLAVVLGRPLGPDDNRPGAEPVVVISHRWWREVFDSDSGALGTTVFLNGRPHTLVGVMQSDFRGSLASFRPDVWVPFEPFRARYTSWDAQARIRERPLVRVYGRLRTGVDAGAALASLDGTAAGLDALYPNDEPRKLRLAPATWIDPATYQNEAPMIRLMAVATAGLAVLVAANVANLLLAAGISRRREFATRVALGASPSRLLRQTLVECLCVSMAAGVIALAASGPLSARIGSYFARPSVWGMTVARETAVDWQVWLFATALAALIGMLAGWLPAWRASREGFAVASGRSEISTRRRRLDARGVLVAAQVALAVVLVVVAGLVLRTLQSAASLDTGFDTERTIASLISTSSTTVATDDRVRFYNDLADKLSEEPWVRSATVADAAPLSGHAMADFRAEGQVEAESLVTALVSPPYLDTLGIGVRRGRNLSVGDDSDAPDVVLVNEAAVERLFGGGEVVGRRIWRETPTGERDYRIVGVVSNAKARSFLVPAEPVVYFSARQHPSSSTTGALLVSVSGSPRAAVPQLERWLRRYEPFLAIINVLPYSDVVGGLLYVQRMNAELFSILAFTGLLLSALGVFSVMALLAGQRTREIGIRMAIGAEARSISRMVLRDALMPIASGVVAGGVFSIAAAGLVRSLLFGVEPSDPVAAGGGLAVVVMAVLAAAYLPARRAARVDPVQALRR